MNWTNLVPVLLQGNLKITIRISSNRYKDLATTFPSSRPLLLSFVLIAKKWNRGRSSYIHRYMYVCKRKIHNSWWTTKFRRAAVDELLLRSFTLLHWTIDIISLFFHRKRRQFQKQFVEPFPLYNVFFPKNFKNWHAHVDLTTTSDFSTVSIITSHWNSAILPDFQKRSMQCLACWLQFLQSLFWQNEN